MRAARVVAAVLVLGVALPVEVATSPACAATATPRPHVKVVVDFGDLTGARGAPGVACVAVRKDATGADVLAARAEQLGTPPPRYHSSGLLCAIDGLPEDGCGDRTDDGYRYWSYWLGDDRGEAWDYASVGPAFRDADPAVVEGWHFVDGAGRPSDPPPSVVPADADCGAAAPPPESAGSARGDAGDVPVGTIAGALALVALVAGGVLLSRRRARR